MAPAERGDLLAAYGRRLRGELGQEEMRRAALAWSRWEGRTSRLQPAPPEALAGRYGDADFALAFARIENHYFLNRGFFPRDGCALVARTGGVRADEVPPSRLSAPRSVPSSTDI